MCSTTKLTSWIWCATGGGQGEQSISISSMRDISILSEWLLDRRDRSRNSQTMAIPMDLDVCNNKLIVFNIHTIWYCIISIDISRIGERIRFIEVSVSAEQNWMRENGCKQTGNYWSLRWTSFVCLAGTDAWTRWIKLCSVFAVSVLLRVSHLYLDINAIRSFGFGWSFSVR